MTYSAKILADSLSPDGVRLTTFEVTFPRIVLAEFNTHRMLSRNSASSRAIPVKKMIEMVDKNPYVPEAFGRSKKGMQAGNDLAGDEAQRAENLWLAARNSAVYHAEALLKAGVHKQLTNRLLEPFMWHTVIVTATEWDNFFHLRDNEMAHPAIAKPARMMRELYESSEPWPLGYCDWHLPLLQPEERDDAEMAARTAIHGAKIETAQSIKDWIKVSVGRCARVSYLTHDGKRDPQADIDLHDRLLEAGHMSPFEHVARPAHRIEDCADECNNWYGNFFGWVQYRKLIPNEADILGVR